MIYTSIKQNAYFDSVSLMLISSRLGSVAEIEDAAAMMGTDHNKELLQQSGLLTADQAKSVTGNDLVIGIKASSQAAIDAALVVLEEQFQNKKTASSSQTRVKTLDAAIKQSPNANLSVISLPGRFAAAEAMKALKKGLHVLLFSDNVSIEEEIELKQYAVSQGLLMMGPDCGTAIINGVALGFANVVREGAIGLAAASGTGLQEVSTLIDRLGGGVSQALGTGGRDLKAQVGGLMMKQSLEALEADPRTKVIGMVSKPPSPEVTQSILAQVASYKKPIVACFLGGDPSMVEGSNVVWANDLEDAAVKLVELAGATAAAESLNGPLPRVSSAKGQYIRALYAGGTLAYETLLYFKEVLPNVYSNIASTKEMTLSNVEVSEGNTVLDLGEDYFTDGKPHPMIDPSLRTERIIRDAKDAATKIILFDCVIGYGAHDNPAQPIIDAMNAVKRERNDVLFIGSVTGTEGDPQTRSLQVQALKTAGAIVLPTNIQAARFAVQALEG